MSMWLQGPGISTPDSRLEILPDNPSQDTKGTAAEQGGDSTTSLLYMFNPHPLGTRDSRCLDLTPSLETSEKL